MSAYYSAQRALVGAVLGTISNWQVRGRERLPRTGGFIVAANHISFSDPPLIGAAVGRESHFLAKQELFDIPVFGPWLRSVNGIPIRRGAADLRGLHHALRALESGGIVVMFPEGSRMRDGELHPARPGVGLLAVNADVPIAPCFISGSNTPRRWWLRRARVRINFGTGRDWRDFAGRDTDRTPGRELYQRIGAAVMDAIAGLREEQRTSAPRGAARADVELPPPPIS